MSLHAAYARRTPFEIAFPDREVVESLSTALAEEARRRGVDDSTPEAFLAMPGVSDLTGALRVEDAPPEASLSYALLLFHCVHFLRAGAPVYLLETPAVRRLVDTAPEGRPEPPARAGYLQLPQYLMWTLVDPEGPPEAIDGVFWSVSHVGMVHALPVSGVQPGKPGFSTLAVPAAPLEDAGRWMTSGGRPSGADFEGALPGGELDGLYSVTTAGEILKLLARFFAHAAAAPGSVEMRSPVAGASEGPHPSEFPYALVTATD